MRGKRPSCYTPVGQGYGGAFWLCLDSAFKQDQFRVSYGCLAGPIIMVLAAGLGQGARRAVLATRSIGVAVGAGPRLVDRLQTNSLPRREVDVAAVASVATQERPGLTPFPSQDRIAMPSRDSALLAIDVLSAHTLSVIQFVDDAFVFQSTMWGLTRACRALGRFAFLWRHRFASGKKWASFLLVDAMDWSGGECPLLEGEPTQHVQSFGLLGPALDRNLSFQPFLEATCARLISENASAAVGWANVAKRLNAAHYKALKAILTCGGYVRLLMVLNQKWRLSSKVAVRILAARARLLQLQENCPVHPAIRGAQLVTGETWLDHSAHLLDVLQIARNFDFLTFSWVCCWGQTCNQNLEETCGTASCR